MTDKTEERIAAEKDAVQKMVGAKGAMDAALQRIKRLEDTIASMNMMIDDLAKNVGDGLLFKTYYGPGRDAEVMPVRKQLAEISGKGRAVL